jgi:hypothetical protein
MTFSWNTDHWPLAKTQDGPGKNKECFEFKVPDSASILQRLHLPARATSSEKDKRQLQELCKLPFL